MIRGEVARNSDGGLEAWVTVSVMDAYGELQQLLGMELLEGSRVSVDAWDGGNVIIEEVRL